MPPRRTSNYGMSRSAIEKALQGILHARALREISPKSRARGHVVRLSRFPAAGSRLPYRFIYLNRFATYSYDEYIFSRMPAESESLNTIFDDLMMVRFDEHRSPFCTLASYRDAPGYQFDAQRHTASRVESGLLLVASSLRQVIIGPPGRPHDRQRERSTTCEDG